MQIVLGSQSPRRKEILSFFSVPFIQVSSDFDEESIPFLGDPIAYTSTLALKKGETVAGHYPNEPVLTADTVVFFEGKIYNKPKNRNEAFLFLEQLSGSYHSVFTTTALSFRGQQRSKTEETKILFQKLNAEQINYYLDHVNFLDKAGGYAIQQGGGILVKRIEGCYYNVMGLPLNSLHELLNLAGIDLWHHLKIL